MPTQNNRSWVLLTSLAGCAGLASTLAFAVEPSALMHLAHASDAQHVSQSSDSAQTLYLIKLLESSSQFRVRAQAAISLGLVEKSSAARDALIAALQDEHPAVRAAAATSLGRIGDAHHVVALRKLGNDPEGPVRNAARTSIGRIESAVAERMFVRETAASTSVVATATHTNHM